MSKGDATATRKDIDDVLGVIKDFSTQVDERFTKIDERFAKIDARFDGVDIRFDGVDARFDGVDARFDGVDARFDRLETKVDKNREDIRKILNILDGFAKRLEINEDERIVMGHQLDRLDKWTHELADKIGYKLKR